MAWIRVALGPEGSGSLRAVPTMLPLAADTFHVPLGIAGGVLVLWAAVIAGLGLRQEKFPGTVGGQRVVVAITVILVATVIGIAAQVG